MSYRHFAARTLAKFNQIPSRISDNAARWVSARTNEALRMRDAVEQAAVMAPPRFIIPNFVRAGDMFLARCGAAAFNLVIHHDDTCHPDDFDCYGPEDVAAWEGDSWWFCGLTLRVTYNGVHITQLDASLWGIEANFMGGNCGLAIEASNMLDTAMRGLDDAKRATISLLGGRYDG